MSPHCKYADNTNPRETFYEILVDNSNGPIEFFPTLMADNAIVPRYGIHRLSLFFQHKMETIKKNNW